MCPVYLPYSKRNPHANARIGNELAPSTLVLWKSIVGHVPAALTAMGKDVNFDGLAEGGFIALITRILSPICPKSITCSMASPLV